MKKSLKNIFTALVTIMSLTASAQEGEFRMTISWNAAVPIGDLKELTGNTTLRSTDVSVLYGINNKIAVGLWGSYADFYEKFPRAVYHSNDGSDVSAVLTNSVQLIPVMASVRYHFSPQARIQPYAAAGVGGNIVIYKQYIGEYPSSDSKLGFAARPELGVYIPFKKDGEAGLNFGVNYTYSPYNRFDLGSLNYIGIKLGIGFPMRD
ncbi:MAG: outer membrane beta-barrel protein [Chitinophagaceae bacterium]|nr:outer membrane beta-barrel protein [Chitinophagaceae bacterium]